MILDLVKAAIPSPIKQSVKDIHRQRAFHRAMQRILQSSSGQLSSTDLNELIYGWGNESFSALGEYIVAFLDHARQCRGPVLECGSGLSTLLLGIEAQRHDFEVWSLEHHQEWGAKIEGQLQRYGLSQVHLCRADLKNYGDYDWYDPPLTSMPSEFALVVCDGPPGETLGGRVGMLPVMRSRLRPGCVILLDDMERQAEQDVFHRWASELSTQGTILGSDKPYGRLVVT